MDEVSTINQPSHWMSVDLVMKVSTNDKFGRNIKLTWTRHTITRQQVERLLQKEKKKQQLEVEFRAVMNLSGLDGASLVGMKRATARQKKKMVNQRRSNRKEERRREEGL